MNIVALMNLIELQLLLFIIDCMIARFTMQPWNVLLMQECLHYTLVKGAQRTLLKHA